MMKIIKQIFCKHEYKAISRAELICLFGIALWGQWNVICAKCDKQKVEVDPNKITNWEEYCKERRLK